LALSVAAIPKPGGFRPPSGPPIHTTFDGNPNGEPDPESARLKDNVERLLASVDQVSADRLDVLLRLLMQRKKWVESELTVERMLSGQTLPPLAAFSIDFLLEPENDDESSYVRLLNRIDDAIFRVRTKLSTLNSESATSDS
jgi:hypothetical protein